MAKINCVIVEMVDMNESTGQCRSGREVDPLICGFLGRLKEVLEQKTDDVLLPARGLGDAVGEAAPPLHNPNVDFDSPSRIKSWPKTDDPEEDA